MREFKNQAYQEVPLIGVHWYEEGKTIKPNEVQIIILENLKEQHLLIVHVKKGIFEEISLG